MYRGLVNSECCILNMFNSADTSSNATTNQEPRNATSTNTLRYQEQILVVQTRTVCIEKNKY